MVREKYFGKIVKRNFEPVLTSLKHRKIKLVPIYFSRNNRRLSLGGLQICFEVLTAPHGINLDCYFVPV